MRMGPLAHSFTKPNLRQELPESWSVPDEVIGRVHFHTQNAPRTGAFRVRLFECCGGTLGIVRPGPAAETSDLESLTFSTSDVNLKRPAPRALAHRTFTRIWWRQPESKARPNGRSRSSIQCWVLRQEVRRRCEHLKGDTSDDIHYVEAASGRDPVVERGQTSAEVPDRRPRT